MKVKTSSQVSDLDSALASLTLAARLLRSGAEPALELSVKNAMLRVDIILTEARRVLEHARNV